MSVQAMAWVIEKSQHGGSALLVLLMIANHTYTDGTGGKETLDNIALECRMSTKSLQRIIKRKLVPSGELIVRRSNRIVSPGEPRNTYALPGVCRDGFHFRGVPGRVPTGKAGGQVVHHVADKLVDTAMSTSKEPEVFSVNLKNPPYPPTTQNPSREGTHLTELFFPVYGETVAVKKPKGRRLWTTAEKETMRGARAEDWAVFLRGKGFEARVVTPEEARMAEGGR